MSLYILLLDLLSRNPKGNGTSKGLLAVEICGRGVGVRGWNPSTTLSGEVVLGAVAEACSTSIEG